MLNHKTKWIFLFLIIVLFLPTLVSSDSLDACRCGASGLCEKVEGVSGTIAGLVNIGSDLWDDICEVYEPNNNYGMDKCQEGAGPCGLDNTNCFS